MQKGPGLAPADARRRRSCTEAFSDLLRQAATDATAAEELTWAYLQLPPVERRALRSAVLAEADELDVSALLACWASVESDPWVMRRHLRAFRSEEGVVICAEGLGGVEAGERVQLHPHWRPGPDAQAIDVEDAVDELAAALWRAHRAGQGWPNELRAFADMFDR